jgi:hypothetical protein
MVLAEAGALPRARAIVQAARGRNPSATLMNAVYVPIAAAAVALGERQPDRAIEALEPARPYELGFVAQLAPVYLRGQAFLMKRAWPEAAAEFRRLLEHRGTEPFSPVRPLAELGLARAAAGQDAARAREVYEPFFQSWANADADLPILATARAEAARPSGPAVTNP